MAASAGIYHEVEHRVSIFVLPREAPFQERAPTMKNDAGLILFYSGEADEQTARANRCRSRPVRSSGRALQALLSSLTAIAMLIFLCSRSCRRREDLALGVRMLPEENFGAAGGAGVCGEMQEGIKILSPHDETHKSVLPGIFEPTAKKAKVVAGAAAPSDAPSCSSRIKRKLATERRDPSPQPASHSPVHDVGTAAQHFPPFPDLPRPSAQQWLIPCSGESTNVTSAGAGLTMAPGERTSAEMTAASALLLLHETGPVADAPRREIKIKLQEGEEGLLPSTSAGGVWRPQPAGMAAGPGEGGQEPCTSLCPGADSFQLQQPALASVSPIILPDPYVPEFYPPALIPPEKHPFFNLPTLQGGVVPQAFDTARACCAVMATYKASCGLPAARMLLAKESLSQEEANVLVIWMQRLAAHCFHYESYKVNATDFRSASDVLARRLVILDAIVSGFIALGQGPSKAWWEQFVQAIPHELAMVSETRKRRLPPSSRHKSFAFALSAALGSLKKGIRPSNQHMFKLKYMIFCSGRATAVFDSPFYDPWKKDCPEPR